MLTILIFLYNISVYVFDDFGLTHTYDSFLGDSEDNGYIITQITENDDHDFYSHIHDGQVTWQGRDGHDYEIFLYDYKTSITTQITNNNYIDAIPHIYDGQITWYGSDGHDYEIFFYDSQANTIIQITNNGYGDWAPEIHRGQVTWYAENGEVYLYDSSTRIITQITENNYHDTWARIHDGQVTWQGWDGHDYEIFLYDYKTGITTQITDNNYNDKLPAIHEGLLTWIFYDGNDDEIVFYNGKSIIQITSNNFDDCMPEIYDGQITWYGDDGHDKEIFLYDGTSIIQLTDNERRDVKSEIHEGKVIWTGADGHDSEIFFYDSSTGIMTQVTDNNYDDSDPQIHNGQISWNGGYDKKSKEIFLATPIGDITPPVIIIEYQNGDGTDGNPGKWNVFAYDDESGINEDTINVLIDMEFAGDILGDYDVPNTLGEHTIYVEVENNDGYLGSESDSVSIIDDDITYPEISYIYTGEGTDENPGEIIVTASDDSGLSIDPSRTYLVPNSLGTHNFILTATDNDNDRVDDVLTRTIEISIDIIDDDITPPEILIVYTGSGLDSNPGYFEWNIFDIDSGISEINITISYESTEGLDDYTIYPEGTAIGSWVLPPNLGIYTLEISARDNDDDRTLIVDSLTTELTRDQEILDDDVDPPELSNLIIIPSIFEINVTFNAIDESGIGDISAFINGELIEPITQIQYGNTYSFIFENQWLFQSGASEVVVQVEDGDDDRPNDALASSITGTFENVLYPTYEYIIWQLEELKNYIDENLCHRVVRSLNRKLTQAQDHLYEAFNYFEDGNITCALFHNYLAKLFIRFAEHRTEIFNRKGLIEDYHTEYIIDSLHEIRNNIVLLMGASTGEKQAYEIALIEVELLNLKDFIEDEIPCCVGRCLSAKISCSAKLLELALFKISMGYSIDCILEYTQSKLEHTITKINFLLEKGKIPEDVANYLIEKISSIIGDIEQIKNN